MTYLAEALRKYYTREKAKIIFSNGLSLQQCAITLWEKLGFSQVDTSVLSRVLKGERLFTPVQLEVFCEVLKLSSSETAHLFRCLSQDHMIKGGAQNIELLESTSVIDTLDFLDNLMEETYKIFHTGAGTKIQKNCIVIQTYVSKLNNQSNSTKFKTILAEMMATSLYLYARSLCTYGLPKTIIEETKPIVHQLIQLQQSTKNHKVSLYLYLLLGEIYYVAGGYSFKNHSREFYNKSLMYNKKVLDEFVVNEYEELVALRNAAASASYIHEDQIIKEIMLKSYDSILNSSSDTRMLGLQLTGTLAKAAALYNLPQPDSLKDKAILHYKNDLTGGGVTEISDIKTELETLKILNIKENNYRQKIATKGLILAERESMPRHIQFFNKELESLEL